MGLLVYHCSLRTQEAEIGPLRVPGQPGLHRQALLTKQKEKLPGVSFLLRGNTYSFVYVSLIILSAGTSEVYS